MASEQQREYQREWREKNRDKVRAAQKRYYEAHKAEIQKRTKGLARKWRQANLESCRAKQREYYYKNKEAMLDNNRKWREAHPNYYEENKETFRESHRKYYHANKERLKTARKEYLKSWLEAHPASIKLYHHKRRAREYEADGCYSLTEIDSLFETQQGCCYYCGKSSDLLQIDHKIPLSRGGSNYIENIALACQRCNSEKNTKTDTEFLEWRLKNENEDTNVS